MIRPYTILFTIFFLSASLLYTGMIDFEFLALTICVVFVAVLFDHRRIIVKPASISSAELLLFFFTIWCLLSYFWSYTPAVTLLDLPLYVIFLFGAYLGRQIGDERLSTFLNAIIAVCSLLALYSLYQFFILNQAKPLGLFANPNINATFFNFALLPLVARYLYNNDLNFRKKLVILIPVILLFSVTLVISSRGAFLSLFVGAFFLIIYFRKRLSLRHLLPIAAAVTIAFISINILQEKGIADRLVTMSERTTVDQASGNRLRIWKPSTTLLSERPLHGFGLSSFWTAYLPVRANNDASFGRYVHNDYFQLLIEVGIIGLVLFLLFWAALSLHTTRRLFTNPVTTVTANHAGIFAALLAILTHALFSFPFYVASTLAISALYIGILLNHLPVLDNPIISKYTRRFSFLLLLPFVYLLIALTVSDKLLKSSKEAPTIDEAMATIAQAESIFPYWDQYALHYAYFVSRAIKRDKSVLANQEVMGFIIRKLRQGLKHFPQRPENFYFQAEMMRLSVPSYPQQQIIENYEKALAFDPAYLPARNSMAHLYKSQGQPQRALEILEDGWGRHYYMESDTLIAYTSLLAQLRTRHEGSISLEDIYRMQRLIQYRKSEFQNRGYTLRKDSIMVQ